MPLPKFKYFENPDRFSVFLDGDTTCDICAETRHCFDASLYFGEVSLEAVCPDCLANGSLADMDVFTCEGDMEELLRQLQVLHPELPVSAREKLAREKTAELEKTTPRLVSWQDWSWPCSDGDYGVFIGFGSKALYNQLAEGNDGVYLFQESLYYSVRETGDADELWETALPDKAIKNFEASQDFDTLFYVFKSLHGDTFITVWDMN